jgi:hypothetical protein
MPAARSARTLLMRVRLGPAADDKESGHDSD